MRKTLIVVILCVLAAAILMIFGFAVGDDGTDTPDGLYALLLTEDRGTDILQLKQGAQAAVEELGGRLLIFTTDSQQDKDQQLLAFLSELSREESLMGLVLPPAPQEVQQAARALADQKQVPLIALWQENPWADTRVSSDREEMGAQLSQGVVDLGRGQPVFVFLQPDQPEQEALLVGLQTHLDAEPTVYRGDASAAQTLLAALPPEAVLCFLCPALTEALAPVTHPKSTVLGIDPGESRISLLESGQADGLLAEMPYAQGYIALRAAGGALTEPILYAPTRLLVLDTLYDAENVKLAFPLLQ